MTDTGPEDKIFSNAGILIVDDEPVILDAIAKVCEHLGFKHIFTATDGFAALRLLDRQADKIDLLSLDMVMPRMDGLKLAETVANTHSRIVGIVMVTGFSTEQLRNEFLSIKSETGLVENFLKKPFTVTELVECYDNALRDVYAKREGQVQLELMTIAKDLKKAIAFNTSIVAEVQNEISEVHSRLAEIQGQFPKLREEICDLSGPGIRKSSDISYVLGLTFLFVFVTTALALASAYLPLLSVLALASVTAVILMLIAAFDLSKGGKLSERSLMEVLRRAFKFITRRK